MKVRDVMTDDVRMVGPNETICDAAKAMLALDAGVIPVADNGRLIGMITDRDIAVRAIAEHKGPDTPVRAVMTPEVKYCYEDEDLEQVAQNMGDIRLRRLPVMSRDKRLVGIVSLGDIAMAETRSTIGEAVKGISLPGGPHSQTATAQSAA